MDQPPPVNVGRFAMTDTHKATRSRLFVVMADTVDALLSDGGIPYSQIPAPVTPRELGGPNVRT